MLIVPYFNYSRINRRLIRITIAAYLHALKNVYLAYKSEDGSQYLLPVVKHAERVVLEETLDHSYLPPHGIDDFSKQATTLLLGNIEKQWKEGMVR